LTKGRYSFFVNFPTLTPAFQSIVHYFGLGSEGVLIKVATGNLSCGLSRGGGPVCNVDIPLAGLMINTWYKIDFVYDINKIDATENLLQAYIDDLLTDTDDTLPAGNSGTAQGGFQISRFSNNNGDSFIGKLDEFKVFNFAKTP